jgi:hypothetical protein
MAQGQLGKLTEQVNFQKLLVDNLLVLLCNASNRRRLQKGGGCCEE